MATRDELLRLYDGELTPAEAERVRRSLTAEDELRLCALAEIGDAVRHHVAAQAGAAPDLWAAIGDRLAATPARPAARRRWRPVSLWVGAIALAAALLLWLVPGAQSGIGATIESIDFGDQAGLIFQIHETQTTVIWQTSREEPTP
jgi:anti-sigma factor RsiW